MDGVNKKHWEQIYAHKSSNEVSWTQLNLGVAASFFNQAELASDAKLIDVGSGRKGMLEFWLNTGFQQLTALDVSANALKQLSDELLEQDLDKVTLVETDVLNFTSDASFDYWNDRAVFHFLTTEAEKQKYVEQVNRMAHNYLCIGTFSKAGPRKCSGLEISQYNPEELTELFGGQFELVDSKLEAHQTPFGTEQEFVFCLFKRKEL